MAAQRHNFKNIKAYEKNPIDIFKTLFLPFIGTKGQ